MHFIYGILGTLIILSAVFLVRDRITGYQVMSTRVVITVPTPNVCNMTFVEGWNLVSFPCLDADSQIQLFLQNTTFQYSTFRSYDASDNADHWKSYNPSLPNWVIQDTGISRRSGYWVYAATRQDLLMNGTLGTPTVMDFRSGWNLMGYPSTGSKESNDTFSQLVPNFEYVYLYNASDPAAKWKMYKLNSSFPGVVTLDYTVPNYGYWIYMTAPDSMTLS
jgi:hypothetical protein